MACYHAGCGAGRAVLIRIVHQVAPDEHAFLRWPQDLRCKPQHVRVVNRTMVGAKPSTGLSPYRCGEKTRDSPRDHRCWCLQKPNSHNPPRTAHPTPTASTTHVPSVRTTTSSWSSVTAKPSCRSPARNWGAHGGGVSPHRHGDWTRCETVAYLILRDETIFVGVKRTECLLDPGELAHELFSHTLLYTLGAGEHRRGYALGLVAAA